MCNRLTEFQVYNVHDTSLHGIRQTGQGPTREDTNTHPPEHAIKMPELRRSRYERCKLAVLLAVSKFPSALQSCGTDRGLLSIMTAIPACLLPPRTDKARCSQCSSPFREEYSHSSQVPAVSHHCEWSYSVLFGLPARIGEQ